MESDPQPNEEVTSANTEINSLTDTLENPAPLEAPTRDVQTFWSRLDTLVTHLETTNIQRKPAFHSFTNQPERVCISSDSDISTAQTQDAQPEQTFSSFKVNIVRPFLEVKSIQLLRASIPNAVTNIPDEECTFWYYRLPIKAFGGTISVSIAGVAGYSNATFTSDGGAITPVLSTAAISAVIPGVPMAGFVTFVTDITGLAVGSRVTIAGISPSGYNGTFFINQVSPPNAFNVANGQTGVATLTNARWTTTITDFIDFATTPYTLRASSGSTRGYYNPPPTPLTFNDIYPNWTQEGGFTGTPIGTIYRIGSFFLPQPTTEYLRMVRLLPSTYKPELFEPSFDQDDTYPPESKYGWNKTFTDYQDLATELAKSCSADPSYDTSVFTEDGFPIFEPGDISITFNETLNKFIFTGNNGYEYTTQTVLHSYLSAGYEDPNLWLLGNPNYYPINAPSLLEFTTASCSGAGDFPLLTGIKGQPYKENRTLNLRLGFTWNGVLSQELFPINTSALVTDASRPASVLLTFLNRLRPIPEYFFIESSPLRLRGVGPFANTEYTADGYANLVNTNTVSLYADFTGASTYDSMTNTQLLACVPMNASNLGVTFYNTTLYCPLTKISDQIYEIEIRMLTDTGAPYVIPNSAIVSLELALTY